MDEVNARGDFGIEMSRLALIDGDRDPWRPMVREKTCWDECADVRSDTREQFGAEEDFDG